MARTSLSADIVGDIYDAALAPDAFARLPEILARIGDGGSAMVGVIERDGSIDAATWNLPDDALAQYGAHYHRVNPFYEAAIARPRKLCANLGDDFVPDLKFRQTEFYCDFARVFDTVQLVGGVFPLSAGRLAEFGLHRGDRTRRFDRRNVAQVQRALPHLRAALRLKRRLAPCAGANLGFAALEALAIGCVICDPKGAILFANAAAEAMAREGGLTLGAGDRGLGAVCPLERKRISAMVADAISGGAGGAIATSGSDGARLFLLIAPLPPRFGVAPGHALVTIRSASDGPTMDVMGLRRIFGLTPAEARLALALAGGRSLADLHADHGASMNTLRTQLAAVLRKTDSTSQRGLVRLIGLMPPMTAKP